MAKEEIPLIVPAPVGTYVLHVIKHRDELVILQHVCTHFERFTDRMVPRCMVAANPNVIEGAVMHPSGHISGGPKVPITFENVEQYRLSVIARHKKPTRRKLTAAEEDLIG